MTPLRWRALVSMSALLASMVGGPIAAPGGQAQGPGRGGFPPGGPGRGGPPARDQVDAARIGTGTIAGTVLTDGTSQPVRRARVTLNGQESQGSRSALTDENGQFVFHALPQGRFTLTASKAGFVDSNFGAKRAGRPGTPIQLGDGQKLEKLVVFLPRGGVLTGVVVDENGDPSPGTQVRAFRYVMRTGERMLQQAGQDQTDDRGVYRIYQLQPGDYIVNAAPRNMTVGDLRESIASEVAALMQQAGQARGAGAAGVTLGALGNSTGAQALLARAAELQQQLANAEQDQASAYAPVYYPGTTSPSAATTVTLGVGEERSGVDFRLQLVPTARVDGVVLSPDGSPLPATTSVALVSADRAGLPSIPGISANTTRPNGTGQFAFRNVTPGQYIVQARANVFRTADGSTAAGGATAGRAGGRGSAGTITQVLWASADVSVNGQTVSGLTLALQPGMVVGGRVEFQGSTPVPTDLSRVRVALAPRGPQTFEIGSVPPADVDAAGRFRLAGVPPGRYAITATAPAGQGGPAGGRGAGRGFAAAGSGTWVLKSAVVNGIDALDLPLEIGPNADVTTAVLTFTDRVQTLSGTIQDAGGRPTADFTIIVFPSDRRFWLPQSRRIASARPGTDGRFTFRGLPPGDYRLTAVTDVEPGEWFDPALLAELMPVSIGISLAEGESKVQDIKLAGN